MKYFMQSGNFIQSIEETFPGISYVQHIDSSSGAVKQISTRDTFQRFPIMEVNGYCQLSGYCHSLKCLFVFSKRKKLVQVWNNMRVTK